MPAHHRAPSRDHELAESRAPGHAHEHGHSRPSTDDHEHGHSHVAEDMLSVEEAFTRIISCFGPLDAEEKPLIDSLDQVLASAITSPLDLPPLANSAMDGYAVRQEDIRGASAGSPRLLRVIGVVAAGQVSSRMVVAGSAIRIMTGAPIPDGGDTVVPFELSDEVRRRSSGEELNEIAIMSELPLGCNVRPAGEDVRRGQLVIDAGTVVRPSELGVMASLGLAAVQVIRRPIVSILSTGDELVSVGHPLEPGKIHDCNSASLAGSVFACGGIPRMLGIARDNLQDMHGKLEQIAKSDLLITSAGVSKGDYDIVKDVLTERGDINFWSVRMRPAKPLAFGVIRGVEGKSIPMLGLPGNPVSALVAFEMFARPAILTMLGKRRLTRPVVEGVLAGPIYNTDGRRVYARVEVVQRDGVYHAYPTGPQGSNILTSMSRANGLAICPEEIPVKAEGELVQIIMLDWNEEVDL